MPFYLNKSISLETQKIFITIGLKSTDGKYGVVEMMEADEFYAMVKALYAQEPTPMPPGRMKVSE